MSGSTLLQDHIEDLKFMINEGKFLTCRSLASQFNLDFNSSQNILDEFFAVSSEFRAIYIISGVLENSKRSFVLVADEEVENAKKKFSTVTAVQIYSIQKDIPQNINNVLSSVEMKHVQEMMLESKSDDLLINNIALITSLDIKMIPNGQRIASTENISLQKSNSNDIRPAESLSKVTSSSNISKGKQTTSHNYFTSKATTITSKNKEDSNVENPPLTMKSSIPGSNVDIALSNHQGASTITTTSIASSKDNNDDAEWDDGSGHQTKPKLKAKPIAIKKRITPTVKEAAPAPPSLRLSLQRNQLSSAAIAALEDDDINDSEDEDDEIDHQNNEKEESPVAVAVVGAMDDFATTGNGNQEKKKKKVLVEKTFADERGYLVTEMVYEEIDIDDANNNPHVLTNESSTIKHTNINNNDSNSSEVTNNTKKFTLIPSKTNSKKKVTTTESTSNNTQQKPISSFFMRK